MMRRLQSRKGRALARPQVRSARRDFPSPPAGRSGVTLVELLVVMLILVSLVVFGGMAYLKAGMLERNLRREAGARTNLALALERIAKELSLANGISPLSKLREGKGVVVSYPLETGGVSFETNFLTRVGRTTLGWGGNGPALTNDYRKADMSTGTRASRPGVDDVEVGLRLGVPRPPAFAWASATNVTDSVLLVTLTAEVPLERAAGGVEWKTVSVDRMVRLWNKK